MSIVSNFVGGQFVEPTGANESNVFNPATGQVVAKVRSSSGQDIEQAVKVSQQAFEQWSSVTPLRRSRIMFRFKELLEQEAETIARAITEEHGKTLSDALGEVRRGIEVVEFACGIPHLLKGEYSENVGTAVDSFSLRQPLGVVAGITPFNFPAMVPMWMFPVALACGNTFILKPSERDPGATLVYAELVRQAGFPDGVFNIIQGGKEVVEGLLNHPGISAVSFVGSTPIARKIYETGAIHGKRVQALGGAKNHMLVMPDADLDSAADALMGAAYGSAGERCMAISVVVTIDDFTADQLKQKLLERISSLKIGSGTDSASDMGPLVTEAHLERVRGYIDKGVKEGATLEADGRTLKLDDENLSSGFFMGATLFDHVTEEMSIYQEEIFGPVLSMVRMNSLEDALALINRHEFGNGVSIFTRSGGAGQNFTHRVKAGMVGINVPIPVPMAFHSFGGWKSSMFGDHHMHGPEGIRFYTRLKTVTARWTLSQDDSAFVMPTM
jgi:malonate-semialdehyde dehydrogenase (acetylating)/methylmalonate-semialdehyde dehydrogenase